MRLTPRARVKLRCVPVMVAADCDEIAMELLRFRDEAGDALADMIDLLTR